VLSIAVTYITARCEPVALCLRLASKDIRRHFTVMQHKRRHCDRHSS